MTDLTVPTDDEFGAHKVRKPYGGTTGRGGSAASREATAREDADGTSGARQRRAISLLEEAGPLGLTWAELSAKTSEHHGKASGVLSVLHKEGVIARLAIGKRARCSVYVLPQYVEGRAVSPHGGKGLAPQSMVIDEAGAALIDRFTEAVAAHPSDKPTFALRTESARALATLLKKIR